MIEISPIISHGCDFAMAAECGHLIASLATPPPGLLYIADDDALLGRLADGRDTINALYDTIGAIFIPTR